MTGCVNNTASSDKTVVIGGKNFTEQDILVYMMEAIIEDKTDINVETKGFLGGTNVVAQALEKGDLDIYPEYTGTGLINILGLETMTDPDAVYQTVKKKYEEDKNIIWLAPFGFNNTYTLAMTKENADRLGIETFSDLAKYASELTLGSTHEFIERPDGYDGLKKIYGMEFKSVKGLDPGLTYAAVKDGKVDVNDAFATDGRIPAFNLKILKDDKNYFPPYYAAPIIRKDTLEKHPELGDALALLSGKLSDNTMSKLNAQVDLDGKSAKDVAVAVKQGDYSVVERLQCLLSIKSVSCAPYCFYIFRICRIFFDFLPYLLYMNRYRCSFSTVFFTPYCVKQLVLSKYYVWMERQKNQKLVLLSC
ncbi:MAG: glycine/betaine ABC transporter substrate-binding protein [Clostridiales bacterium GWB2_37_7]|nr:MAG: glycine/betaine ABC transporter substrate-binding protein [Clostridiales bacterium GWB2_37_7]